MSQPSPSPVAVGPARHDTADLTPDGIESVLAEFRSWLQEAASRPNELLANGQPAETPIDLATLLAQFTALRHEVNLQTRATRGQQEQNTETLRQLSAALEALQSVKPSDSSAVLRPLLKALVDVRDALALAEREVQRVGQSIRPALDNLAAAPAAGSLWKRWFARPEPDGNRAAAEQVRKLLDSVVTGYTMSLQRADRALQQQGLEAIPCVGQRFDPERMEVVEATADSGRPAGEVIEVARPGYLWNGTVFRYAQVRVAK
jgi:molecular chaperone GrpE